MNKVEVETLIKAAITRVAPDADPDTLAVDDDMRDELDLDSMDFLNIIIRVAKETGVNIPESDYAKVFTLGDMTTYVMGKSTP